MSDLVEKVRSEVMAEMHKSRGATDMDTRVARRAIKAVAEHIEAQCAHGSNTWFVAQRLRAQLKEGSE